MDRTGTQDYVVRIRSNLERVKNLYPQIGHLIDEIATDFYQFTDIFANEMEMYRNWVCELQRDKVINCVYCGYCFGPLDDGVPQEILREHMRSCEQHPLHTAVEVLQLMRAWMDDNAMVPPEAIHDGMEMVLSDGR